MLTARTNHKGFTRKAGERVQAREAGRQSRPSRAASTRQLATFANQRRSHGIRPPGSLKPASSIGPAAWARTHRTPPSGNAAQRGTTRYSAALMARDKSSNVSYAGISGCSILMAVVLRNKKPAFDALIIPKSL